MPAPKNQPGFVSFNDYLNANQGALEKERADMLGGATSAADTATADWSAASGDLFNQGQQAAKDAWSAQREGVPLSQQKSTDYKAPTDGVPDLSKSTNYDQFITDRQKAVDSLGSLTDANRAGDKYGAFESGLLGADTKYQGDAKALQDKYADTFSNYLDSATKQYQAGVDSFKPAPITTYQPEGDPRMAPTTAPDGTPIGNEGPVQKPQITRRKYIDGKPQPLPGEEEIP